MAHWGLSSSQVWHHLQIRNQAAGEFFRCLKSGGGLFIKTYSHAQIQSRYDLQFLFPELMPLMLSIYPDVPDYRNLLSRPSGLLLLSFNPSTGKLYAPIGNIELSASKSMVNVFVPQP